MKHQNTTLKQEILRIVLFVVSAIIILIIAVLFPWNVKIYASHPDPAQTYEQALARIEKLKANEPGAMNPLCRLQLLSHGSRVAQAVILVHGYTNCPQQFRELGQRFYDTGYNVLLVPMPHHGLVDRMTEELTSLKTEELVAYADESVNIAHGLGERVTMLGI